MERIHSDLISRPNRRFLVRASFDHALSVFCPLIMYELSITFRLFGRICSLPTINCALKAGFKAFLYFTFSFLCQRWGGIVNDRLKHFKKLYLYNLLCLCLLEKR